MEAMKDYEIIQEWNPWESIDGIPEEPTAEQCEVVFRQLKETQRHLHIAMQILMSRDSAKSFFTMAKRRTSRDALTRSSIPMSERAFTSRYNAGTLTDDNAYNCGTNMLASIDEWMKSKGNGVTNQMWDQWQYAIDDILMDEMEEERQQRIQEHQKTGGGGLL